MNRTSNWKLALDVAKNLGLPVFPCREQDSEFAVNGKIRKMPAKAPYTANGYKAATKSLDQIDSLWTRNPNAMVGVPMGAASGLIAIDIDEGGDKSGEATFLSLGLSNPETVQTRTMSGGRHLLFKAPDDIAIRNDASKIFGKHIDVRGEGGYVIWAGSEGANGSYSYINGFAPGEKEFAELTAEFRDFFLNQKTSSAVVTIGARNNELFNVSVKSVHAGMADGAIASQAAELNQSFVPPLGSEEVQTTVENAISYRAKDRYQFTDLGNAERFRRDHKGDVIFVPEMKSWLAYNNGLWSADKASVSQRMHKTVRSIIEEGAQNIDDQDALLRWRKRSEDNARLRAATDIASTLEGLVKPVSELDTKPNLLNLPNGTMELKTQTFRDHRPTIT